MKSDRVGSISISRKALLSLLRLPDDIEFLRVNQEPWQVPNGDFTIIVRHSSLNEVPQGNGLPWVNITVHNAFCSACEQTHLVKGELTQ